MPEKWKMCPWSLHDPFSQYSIFSTSSSFYDLDTELAKSCKQLHYLTAGSSLYIPQELGVPEQDLALTVIWGSTESKNEFPMLCFMLSFSEFLWHQHCLASLELPLSVRGSVCEAAVLIANILDFSTSLVMASCVQVSSPCRAFSKFIDKQEENLEWHS